MRRGRTGLGGWRNENPRHFKPRGGGPPHFRSSRSYVIADGPRFPPPGPRLNRPPPFGSHPSHGEHSSFEQNDRNQYRSNHQNNNQGFHERGQYRNKNESRHAYSYTQQTQHNENDSLHTNTLNFYEDTHNFQVKNTVNIGHSHAANNQHIQNYDQQNINHNWFNPNLENKISYYQNKSPTKPFKHHESSEPTMSNIKPLLNFSGHRPPSSDYYGSVPSLTTSNNSSFNCSVDDTVDIVRKRLLTRNDSQIHFEDKTSDLNASNPSDSYQNNQNDTFTKKKISKQKQTVKSNCDKIKNKIVHQLFKMDKDKIHKLMDNPKSSSKFEYAISSLITESQISLNRHLRSVAEKSLCSSSSTDFIHNDNNTIYEDTFMKQMQCILDPQDTVLLEDMKPLVMAELSKFLKLEDCDQSYDVTIPKNNANCQPGENIYDNDCGLSQFSNHSQVSYNEDKKPELSYDDIDNFKKEEYNNAYQEVYEEDIKPLYERRSAKKSNDYSEERRQSSESRRKSVENKPLIEPYKTSPESGPLFDPNTDISLDEDDPFAELDKQYHVPVDHNFIQADSFTSLPRSFTNSTKTDSFYDETSNTPCSNSKILPSNTTGFDKNLKSEMQNIAMSLSNLPISKSSDLNGDIDIKLEHKTVHNQSIDQSERSIKFLKVDKTEEINSTNLDNKYEYIPKTDKYSSNKSIEKYIDKKEPDKNEIPNNFMKSCTESNSRKRTIDQRESHRKEKKKKSELSPTRLHQDLIYKNRHTNSSYSKTVEKERDSKKSYIYSYFSKNEKKETKDTKKIESTDKTYSDKYVRRKEQPKKKDTEISKKRNSNSLSSPKDNNNYSNSSSSSLTPTKSDSKTKLKPINMFEEQSKKVNLHQAHRNTALPTSTPNKIEQISHKPIKTSSSVKCIVKPMKRYISQEIQTIAPNNSISKLSQTENKTLAIKAVQTDPVFFERFKSNSTDTLERMKEIDLEIQVLLQEKFKLYSSLENKDSCQNTMHTLGMAVVNVTPLEETRQDDIDVSADSIIDDFTNIPVEELEQIALETIEEHKIIVPEKRTRRVTHRVIDSVNSSSSVPKRTAKKKTKSPNISLLEQIIIDDRPLEDIILLDEFEKTPAKKKSKKKATKKRKPLKRKVNIKTYNLKDCSVVLKRTNIKKYMMENSNASQMKDGAENSIFNSAMTIESSLPDIIHLESCQEFEEICELTVDQESAEIIEDSNIQFDMLDVSEDIVIGDNCEVKSQDKYINERIDVAITEEIILDNSQSSCDDLTSPNSSQKEQCKMYDYSTDENLRNDSITVTGNGDAVLALECVDSYFIAASLDGNVYHFNSDGQLLNTLRGSNLAVTCLTIVKEKYGTTVYTGSLDSRIRYYDLETGVEKGPECNVLSPIQTMDRAWETIFVGTRTGFVLQFLCKNNMLIPVSSVKFSEQSILALRAMKEGPRKVLLVAARSENVTIKDAQTGLLLRSLNGPKMTVYTLLFEDGKVYCGTSSHQIHVFDYTSGGHVGSHEGGKGTVCLRATGGLVFAGCYDGCVYVYREGETRPLAQLRGPSLMLLSLAIVGSKIIAGYKDRSLYIWKIPLAIMQEMIL